MTIKDENLPDSVCLTSDFETFLEQNMSNQNKKVLAILKQLGNNQLTNLYKTALFCIFQKDVPFRQMLCAHCMRELFNIIIRRNQKSLKDIKEHLYQVLSELPLITNSEIGADVIKEAVPIDMDKLANFHFKIKAFLQHYRPKLSEDEILSHTDNVLKAKGKLESLRHIDEGKATSMEEEDFLYYVSEIEKFFLQLEPTFLEKKESIDELLEKANSN